MLSDRPYMRDDYQREKTSVLTWLLCAIIAGFVLQTAEAFWFNRPGLESFVALSPWSIQHGFVWTLLTYPLLHRDVLHVLVTVLSIFFVGRELTVIVGERRLTLLALLSPVVGGLFWLGLHFNRGGELMGATPILWCYFTLFACLFANRQISFLVFFVFPVTLRPKYVLWAMVGIDLIGFFLGEVSGKKVFGYNLPYSAHLGAILVGWIYFRYVHEAAWLTLRPRAEIELPRWMKRARKASAPAPAYHVNVGTSNRADIRAEVDRILDKINSQGFGALTPEEKHLLDEAKDLLSRR